MAYVSILSSSGSAGRGLGAFQRRPAPPRHVLHLMPRRRGASGFRGIGYAISGTAPYFLPDLQTEVIITPTNGAAPYAVVSTESYLQSNLIGQMQNSYQYNGWSLSDWITAITADAVQRCTAYPGSCGSSTPAQLGQKYGTLAYQIMQLKAAAGNAAQPPNVVPTPDPGTTSQPANNSRVGGVSIVDDQTGSTSQFRPGDTFTLRIVGATPSAAVNVSVGGNTQAQGTTDGAGNFTLHGTVPNSPGTSQSQGWTVGGIPASPSLLTFSIVAPASSPQSTTPPASSQPAPTQTSSTPPYTPPSQVVSTPSGFDLSFLTNPISLFGYDVPLWMLVAGGVGAVVVVGSMGKGR